MSLSRRKVLKLSVTATAGCALSSLLPGVSLAAGKSWDMSDEYSEGGFTGQASLFFIKELKKRVGDELDIVYHGGKSLGFRSVDHFDAVQDGAVQMAITQTGQLGGQNPLFDLSALPFLCASMKESRVLWNVSKPDFAKIFDDANMVVLYAVPNAPSGIHAKHPVTSLEALKGLRLRTYDALGTKTFASLGAAPMQIAFGDLVPQLSTNGIDAVLTSADGGMQISIWDYLSDFTDLTYVMSLFMAHVNKDSYAELSDKARDAIQEVSALTDDFAWKYVEDAIEKSFQVLESHNYRITRDIPSDFLATLHAAGDDARKAWFTCSGALPWRSIGFPRRWRRRSWSAWSRSYWSRSCSASSRVPPTWRTPWSPTDWRRRPSCRSTGRSRAIR